jgi:hypothetical protein
MNACGEVISAAKQSDNFTSTTSNKSILRCSNSLSSFYIRDKFNNVAIIDIPGSLIPYTHITKAERIKFDFQFNSTKIIKIPKNATVMLEAMNKKKRTFVLQSFSQIKNTLNDARNVLPLIFTPFMEVIRIDQSWYTIIDTFDI